jgi:Glycosyltransferase family 87
MESPARARWTGRVLLVLSVIGWVVFAYATIFAITTGWQETTGNVRQVDWHVYLAGAHDLVDGTLYTKPLALGSYPLSSPEFNLPPLSALWALPLLPLPVEVGGDIWQFLAAASIAVAGLVAADVAGLRRPWVWAGIVLGALSLTLLYLEGLHLGTNNYLVLGLVACFAWLYLCRHERAAGALLGIAIGTKLWPVVLLAMVLRERRWTVLAWCAGALTIQLLVFTVWLGPGSWAEMIRLIRTHIPPTGILIGPTAVDGLREVWNSGLGIAVAIVLLLIPARGRVEIGIAILAGLAPIANLWVHYDPTILFALVLLLASGWRRLTTGGAVPQSVTAGA